MACHFPLTAWRSFDGSVTFGEKKDSERSFQLPCGKCTGCRLERSRQWAIRCMHEASLYQENCFVTLTYNDEHVPKNGSLFYSDFQKFMRRVRKRFAPRVIRFYMAGEYGDEFGRPHYHCCLFNVDFVDRVVFKKSGSGSTVYTSKILDSLWCDKFGSSIGFCSVGEVTFESAAYVARYIMKKQTGKGSEIFYEDIDVKTGEVSQMVPEFNHMSLKPGIGAGWFEKWSRDVFPHDYVVVNGVKCKPPKFYLKRLGLRDKSMVKGVQERREARAFESADDNTRARLAVKERVLVAKLHSLKRSLE